MRKTLGLLVMGVGLAVAVQAQDKAVSDTIYVDLAEMMPVVQAGTTFGFNYSEAYLDKETESVDYRYVQLIGECATSNKLVEALSDITASQELYTSGEFVFVGVKKDDGIFYAKKMLSPISEDYLNLK
ncbi:MAG: hypothetical protein V1725_04315 [archaeon]